MSLSSDRTRTRPHIVHIRWRYSLTLSLVLQILILGGFHEPTAAQEERQTPKPQTPKIADRSDEGQKAMRGFVYPSDLKVNLFAAEPDLANPVAFHVDHQGRVFVCESFRQGKGIEDNRNHPEWLDDDLAAQSVSDRIAYIKKHLKEKAIEYTRHDDRIRLLIDTDNDGVADSSKIFAQHFNRIEMGSGAGVLSFRDKVYFTCIPELFLLQDKDGDGRSDSRKSLSSGYGVRFAFRGHDLHGLIVGPDGRLYFSIGDRGYNISPNVKDPASGAVFRCELDGSRLEVIATGLRNPQELAFDDFGNLFTGDNNSDGGDRARWVYVVQGSDSGWRMHYQYLPDRGPFKRENIWQPYSIDETPAYIVPPVTNLADGPSGLAFYPGTGLGDEFKGRFFLCDFRGGPANSGIRTFRVKPQGAFFEVTDMEQPFWRQLVTDVQFAPDGSMMVTDWVNGWNGLGKGRIYRYTNPATADDPTVKEVQSLLGSGLQSRDLDRLVQLLDHPDRRVRKMAQFELVDRNQLDRLVRVAIDSEANTLPRIHAIWGVGQLARRAESSDLLRPLKVLFDAADNEVLAQFIKLIGEAKAENLADPIPNLLAHDNARIRFFAAMAAGATGLSKTGVTQLFKLLEDNANKDPMLRHAAIMALTGNPDALRLASAHPSRFVRIAAVVAQRKRNADTSEFLSDPEPKIVLEAVRALHDPPSRTTSDMRQLAPLIDRPISSFAVMHRVLNANYILGAANNAMSIARFAAERTTAPALRLEAVAMLRNWSTPSNRDRVLGAWRPMSDRTARTQDAAAAIEKVLPALLSGEPALTRAVIETAAALKVDGIKTRVKNLFVNVQNPDGIRADALRAMAALKIPQLKKTVTDAAGDNATPVRIAALEILANLDAKKAAGLLKKATRSDALRERQAAFRTLGEMDGKFAEPILTTAMRDLLAGEIPMDSHLDVLQAANNLETQDLGELVSRFEKSKPEDDPLREFTVCLEGGNRDRGRTIFFEKASVYCVRCHKIGDQGGEVGPDLSAVAKDKDRRYLLESIVQPNAAIAKNFETVMVATDDGLTYSGILKSETDDRLVLISPEARTISIDKETIEQRGRGNSSMPADLIKNLTRSEIRDLVEFLSSLK